MQNSFHPQIYCKSSPYLFLDADQRRCTQIQFKSEEIKYLEMSSSSFCAQRSKLQKGKMIDGKMINDKIIWKDFICNTIICENQPRKIFLISTPPISLSPQSYRKTCDSNKHLRVPVSRCHLFHSTRCGELRQQNYFERVSEFLAHKC